MRHSIALGLACAAGLCAQITVPWSSGRSTTGAQRLERIKWSTPIDLAPNRSEPIRYRPPLITDANTVLVSVRTGLANKYLVEAHNGSNGSLLYTLPSDYTPLSMGIPLYGPALSRGTRVYYPGAGGTVYYRDQPNSATGPSGQIAFYGNRTYSANQAAFDDSVAISTPITADGDGNIYFGFTVTGPNPANLSSGMARIAADGTGSWIGASAAAGGDSSVVEVALNCAPALSTDGATLYFAARGDTGHSEGYLVAVNSATLAFVARARLVDPETGTFARAGDEASPIVDSEGDVYYGVLESAPSAKGGRGWLLHFDRTLATVKTPGASNTGPASYLLLPNCNAANGGNRFTSPDRDASETAAIRTSTIANSPVREACAATAIGVDGTVYLIDGATLFAVGQASNLTIASNHKGNFAHGQKGAVYTLTATNTGTAATNGAVVVADTLPDSLTATSIGGAGWSCAPPSGPCSRNDTLDAGGSYPALTLEVDVAGNGPSSVTNTAAISSDGAANSVNFAFYDATRVMAQAASLSIAVSHTGNFTQKQTGVYTVTVSNASGAGPTTGTVTMTEVLPEGLSVSAMAGSGWNCPPGGVTCSRTDSLMPGQSFGAIAVTVNVSRSAPAQLVNQVSVSYGGGASANAADPTTILAIPFALDTVGVPTAIQYQSYVTYLIAEGGVPPYSWSVAPSTGVSLPEGMSLDPVTGVVSATQVNGQGGYEVTIQVSDSASPPSAASRAIDFPVYSDTGLAGCQMFPPDSVFNQRIDTLPADLNPEHQIPASYLSSALHPDFGQGNYPFPGGIPWMRVPANQPLSNVNVSNDGQIELSGTYRWPLPPWPDALVEGTSFGVDGSDHHILILQSSTDDITGPQTGACTLYETYSTGAVSTLYDSGSKTWFVGGGIHYDLSSNQLAASADALDSEAQDSSGIPILPLLIRYSEVPLGTQHPVRITFPSPTNWFVWPGTGCCANSGPPQGLLYRLKAGVNWQATCPVSSYPQAATVLQAMQQYGAYMSDHGGVGFVGGVPDARWDDDDLGCIKHFHISDLEVVDNAALEVSSISGQTKPYVPAAALPVFTVGTPYSAAISETGGNPAFLQWSIAAGSLPPGLSLDPVQGTIGGTPLSSSGSPYIFAVIATDTASGDSSNPQQFALGITAPPLPRLIVVPSHTGNTSQTVNVTLSIDVMNLGTASTSGVISVVDTLPAGMTAISISGSGWNCTLDTLTCTRSDSLTPGGSYPVSVTAYIGFLVPYVATNVAAVSGGGQTATASDTLISRQFIGLTVTSAHAGSFSQGQTGAAYSIAVTNIGQYSTIAALTLVDTVPAGLTATAISGSGWNCTLATLTCTRGDVLDPGHSYPAVVVTVNVSSGAPSQVINAVSVSTDSAAPASGQDPTTILTTTLTPQTITFGALPDLPFGSAPFLVNASASSMLPVSFASTTASVCTVSSATVTAIAGGKCTVQATQAGNATYAAASPVSQSFLVTQAGQTISFPAISNQYLNIGIFGLSATASSGLAVSFVSTTASVCTVSAATVTPIAAGTCTIQAMQAGDSNYAPATPVSESFGVMDACEVSQDGSIGVVDVQRTIDQALGASQRTVDLDGDGAVTLADIQIVSNDVLGKGCAVGGVTLFARRISNR